VAIPTDDPNLTRSREVTDQTQTRIKTTFMARRTEITLKDGSKEPVIIYDWRGITVIRVKGATGRQAKVAKEQASLLGLASNLSARLRNALGYTGLPAWQATQLSSINYGIQQYIRKKRAGLPAADLWVTFNALLYSKNQPGEIPPQLVSIIKAPGDQYALEINPAALGKENKLYKIKLILVALDLIPHGNTQYQEADLEFTIGQNTQPFTIPIDMEIKEGEMGVVGWRD